MFARFFGGRTRIAPFAPLLGVVLFFAGGVSTADAGATALPVFRLHLQSEPGNLDPGLQKTSASSYLLQNLFRNLFRFDDDEGLVPDLAEKCARENHGHRLVCHLKKGLRWSDGQPLTAEDFVRNFRRVLDPNLQAPRSDFLFAVRNAEDVYAGKKPPGELGITAPDARTLKFELSGEAPDFEYNLATTILAPFRGPAADPRELVTSGPYKIELWERGRRLRLVANPNYQGGAAGRPDVEFLFVNDDATALKLFEKGQLDFLRRLPTSYIPERRGSPEFHWVAVSRLDHLGFGPKFRTHPNWREALALSLDYEELARVFHAEGRPGCVGLPARWTTHSPICLNYDVARAKKALGDEKPGPLRYAYSTQGGEDHRRTAEWLQEQWRQHLGLAIRIEGLENKHFLSGLKDDPPDLFRKGVAPDRPTCLAALEPFATGLTGEATGTNDATFVRLLGELARAAKPARKQELCEKALRSLLDRFAIIPLGPMHFAILAKTEFTGWKLNQMNQLDLANLTFRDPKATPAATPSPQSGLPSVRSKPDKR